MINKDLIDELKTIIKEDYGIDLTKQEIYEVGYLLISSFELLIKIDSKNKSVTSNKDYVKSETA